MLQYCRASNRAPHGINAIGYPKFYSRSHDAVIRVYDDAGNLIETHEGEGDFKESWHQIPKLNRAREITSA